MSKTAAGDTRERLLETAMELISTESYASVSVDDICKKAKIKTGSFYYFFPSKADLAVAAFENKRKQMKPLLDGIFSSEVPPLQRILDFFELSRKTQIEKMNRYGFVCGCAYTSLGSEQGTQNEKLRKVAQQVLDQNMDYVESALRDAAEAGTIPPGDIKQKTHEVCALYLGVMVRAKIENNLSPFKDLRPGFYRLVGLSAAKAAV